jgi:hypothetical protein
MTDYFHLNIRTPQVNLSRPGDAFRIRFDYATRQVDISEDPNLSTISSES